MTSKQRRGIAIAVVSTAAESAFLRVRTGKWAGKVTVRCRDGHEFPITWVPGISFTSIRLGPWRVRRCPVGRHWSIVTPVKAL